MTIKLLVGYSLYQDFLLLEFPLLFIGDDIGDDVGDEKDGDEKVGDAGGDGEDGDDLGVGMR